MDRGRQCAVASTGGSDVPKIQPPTSSFNAGELSPRLAARTDFQKYPAGLEEVLNLIPLAEGGLMRRSGTRFVAEVADSTKKSRLKPFQFSTQDTHVLEFGDNVMRFFRNQGQLFVAQTDATITNGTFDADISGWTDLSTGTSSIVHDATLGALKLNRGDSGTAIAEQGVTTSNLGQVHVLRFRIRGGAGDSAQILIRDATDTGAIRFAAIREAGWHTISFTPQVSPFFLQFRNIINLENLDVAVDDVSITSNAPLEISTPWGESDLFDVSGTQSVSVFYLFHETTPTYKLQRFDLLSWSLVEVAWRDGPWGPKNATPTTLTLDDGTANATIPTGTEGVSVTASNTFGVNGNTGFTASDIGRLIRYRNVTVNTGWTWLRITGVTSDTVVTANLEGPEADRNEPDSDWRLGAWSITTGYPQNGAFFEQRLFAAATTDQAQTLWASQTGNFENMSPDNIDDGNNGTVEDDDALNFTLSADNVNAIRWMSAGEDVLAIGTKGGEWVPSSRGPVLTPLDISIRRQTTHGSAATDPLRLGAVVLFVQRERRKLREFGFSFESDGFKAPDMTRLATHITRSGIVEMAYAQERESIVWSVLEDGTLLSMTFRRDEDVVGWARHRMGGAFAGGAPPVETVTSIPGRDALGQVQSSSDRSEVWMIVKRTVNGVTRRYVEVLERDFEDGDAQVNAYYADSLITYDGVPTTTITGLDHLEGETVKVWGDGSVRPDKVVSGGQITLDLEASVAQVGLGYTHRAKTLKVEGGNPSGTSVGRTKRIVNITFVILNGHTLRFGPTIGNMGAVDFRVVSDSMDAGVPLFTGERMVEFEGDWDTDTRIVIEDDSPAPFILLAMVPEIDIRPQV